MRLIHLVENLLTSPNIKEVYLGDIDSKHLELNNILYTPLDKLPLSIHTKKVLRKNYIESLKLIVENKETLPRMYGACKSVLEEVDKVLNDMLGNLTDQPSLDEIIESKENIFVYETTLSVRSKCALTRKGYKRIYDILDLTYDDLVGIRNLGTLSIKEILEYIDELKGIHGIYNVEKVLNDLKNSMEYMKDFKYSNYPLYKFSNKLIIKHRILSIDGVDCNTTFKDYLNIIIEKANSNNIDLKHLYKIYQFCNKYLYSNFINCELELDEKKLTIIKKRFDGSTLQEIGQMFDQSSERIRQIEKETVNIINTFLEENDLKDYFYKGIYTKNNPTLLSDKMYEYCFYVLDKLIEVKKVVDNEGNVTYIKEY
jgi:hypothetical protein